MCVRGRDVVLATECRVDAEGRSHPHEGLLVMTLLLAQHRISQPQTRAAS